MLETWRINGKWVVSECLICGRYRQFFFWHERKPTSEVVIASTVCGRCREEMSRIIACPKCHWIKEGEIWIHPDERRGVLTTASVLNLLEIQWRLCSSCNCIPI